MRFEVIIVFEPHDESQIDADGNPADSNILRNHLRAFGRLQNSLLQATACVRAEFINWLSTSLATITP